MKELNKLYYLKKIIKQKTSHTIITGMGVFMIVLNKKTIRIFTLSIFAMLLCFAIFSDKKESVPTVSLPVSGKTIVIDAGHPRYLLTR